MSRKKPKKKYDPLTLEQAAAVADLIADTTAAIKASEASK